MSCVGISRSHCIIFKDFTKGSCRKCYVYVKGQVNDTLPLSPPNVECYHCCTCTNYKDSCISPEANTMQHLLYSQTRWTCTRLCSEEFYKSLFPHILSPRPPHTPRCPCTSTSPCTLHSLFLLLLLELADPDTLVLSPAHGSDGSRLSVDGSSPSWAYWVCPAHCPLQLIPSLPCPSHRKLLISTGTTQLSQVGLAIPICIAIYDSCSKCNIWLQFWPQNSLIMQLCMVCVLPVDPKVSHAKNEPDPWRTENTRGAHTNKHIYPNSFIYKD